MLFMPITDEVTHCRSMHSYTHHAYTNSFPTYAPQDAPTIDEYLDIFDVPLTIDLDSEQVWPMPMHPRI